MILDLVVLAALAATALGGAISGALRQVAQLAAVGVGWVAARHLAPAVADGFARTIPAAIARPAASALLFVGGYAAAGILANVLLRSRGMSSVVNGGPDSGLGALLGGAKGALIAWVILSAAAFTSPFRLGPVAVDPKVSDFAAFARGHNLLARFDPERARTLERVLELARDPLGAARLGSDPDARRLLADPRVRELASRSPGGVEGGPSTAETERLLADPEIAELLARLRAREADAGSR